nr:O-antigen ligase family protein [Clostridium paridis]
MYSGKWYLYIYEVIILVLSFMTGARTPLIIIALLGIMNFIFDIKNRIKYWKINLGLILSSVVIFVLTGLFKHLPLIEKTIRTSTAGGFTSGRNVFWRYLIDYYVNKFTIFEKLFGSGMDITVFINETYYKMAIWAHNDFIQVLLSYGLIGVLLYIVILLKSIKTINLWILSGFIFLAVFNGLFNYHLFIFTLPFFTVIKILYSEKYKEVKE